jgi:hypothetical protein
MTMTPARQPADRDQVREAVRSRYGGLARAAQAGETVTDGDPGAFAAPGFGAGGFGAAGYPDASGLPGGAVRASLGCGNPVAVADLHPGETVLDLGSGGGIDVLLSARRAGPAGTAYGLDMIEEMLDPGRLGVCDILADDDLTPAQRIARGGQAGCIAEAPSFAEYRGGLTRAGFTGITITATHQVGDGVHAAVIRAARAVTHASPRRGRICRADDRRARRCRARDLPGRDR